VARELVDAGIAVRWCVTLGEQCHSKLLILHPSLEAFSDEGGDTELILGSANFTRRNLEDLNLETSVRLVGPVDTPAITDALAFFERQWASTSERRTSEPFEAHGDVSIWQNWRYRVMEATGLSTF
jgi:phosphatidylserine/phosphatidylglycerophosphate/cardiolipin synthase-like enzyme